jgi:DNA-binding MarR family transcriptional regulator
MVDRTRQDVPFEAIEALYFAYRAFTDRPDRILERRGLGRVHHRILYFVGRHPEISVRGLLEVLAVSKQALNAPLRQMVEMHLVAVTPGAQDRRVKQLRLTDEGARLEDELTNTQMRLLRAAFEASGEDAQAGWLQVMTALAAERGG